MGYFNILVLVVLCMMGSALSDCESGWTKNGDFCYRVGGVKKSRPNAKEICESYGSSLATIENAQEDAFIRQFLAKQPNNFMFWINGNWIHGNEWEWDDGHSIDYFNWYKSGHKEPDNIGKQKCLALRRGFQFKWSNDYCHEQWNFICKKPQPQCPSGWIQYKESCYFLGRNKLSKIKAQEACLHNSASLVAIESKDEHDFIRKTLTKDKDNFMYWINGNDFYGDYNWRFENGREMNYKAWFKGWHKEPDNKGKQHCLAVRRGFQFYISNDYCHEAWRYVCEKPLADETYGY